ncbi:MAG: DUF4342 domain-containing protein [Firmicutes bacterium]|nr:DUF4342 domain-containing protein [Bacillota bacterium]
MEITLEKIELVKDRTGVSYKEAKEALEAVDGSVVDAIIAIEETVNLKSGNKASEFADDTVKKIKEFVKKGNITKISVKKDEETLVNIPLNIGLVGALVAPWGIIAATIAAFGFKCQVELTKDDGTIIDISERAEDIANDVKEKGAVVVDEVVAKGSAVYEDLKANAPDKMVELKEKGASAYNSIVEKATETWNEIKDKKNEDEEFEIEFIFDEAEAFFDAAEEKVEEILNKAEEKVEEVVEK